MSNSFRIDSKVGFKNTKEFEEMIIKLMTLGLWSSKSEMYRDAIRRLYLEYLPLIEESNHETRKINNI